MRNRDLAEKSDLNLLVACIVTVPLTWILLLNWNLHGFLLHLDALMFNLPVTRDLLNHGGALGEMLYRSNVLGGVELAAFSPPSPILQLASWLHLSPLTAMNLELFLVQVIMAYLCTRITYDLAALWKGPSQTSGNPLMDGPFHIGMIWIFAFAPVIAWRMQAGHPAGLTGNFGFFVAMALILAWKRQRISTTSLFVVFVAICHLLPSPGNQQKLYNVIFGGPLLLSLLLMKNRKSDFSKRVWILASMIILSAILIGLPGFIEMLRNSKSTDFLRSATQLPVIYSYTIQGLHDWLSSLPWTSLALPSSRAAYFLHETNYPIGPVLLLLLLVPWKNFRGPLIAFILSFLVVIAFSSQVSPISEWLPAVVPSLNSFRVPARAVFIFSMLFAVFGLSGLIHRFGETRFKTTRRQWAFTVLAALVILMMTSQVNPSIVLLREWLCWIFAALVVLAFFGTRKRPARNIPLTAFVLLLGAVSVSAFKERQDPFYDAQDLLEAPTRLGQFIMDARPELRSPLTRVYFDEVDYPAFLVNSGLVSGLSTVSGYWPPQRRFAQLYSVVRGVAFSPTQHIYSLDEKEPGFNVFQQLYNICCKIHVDDHMVELIGLEPTLGRAWFSSEIMPHDSLEGLVTNLLHQKQLYADLKRTQRVLSKGEESVAPLLRQIPVSTDCATAVVDQVDAEQLGQKITLQVHTSATCPLTLSTNYATILRAKAISSSGEERFLEIYPAYGALTGVLVPADVKKLIVEPQPPGWFARWIGLAGVLLALVGFGFFTRFKNSTPQNH